MNTFPLADYRAFRSMQITRDMEDEPEQPGEESDSPEKQEDIDE